MLMILLIEDPRGALGHDPELQPRDGQVGGQERAAPALGVAVAVAVAVGDNRARGGRGFFAGRRAHVVAAAVAAALATARLRAARARGVVA